MSVESFEPLSKRTRLSSIQLYEQEGGLDVAQRKVMFASGYPVRDLKLMEVPKELLQSVLDGDEVRIVGSKGSEAMLCSEHKSYSMKRVETSNSVFFVPPSSSGVFQIETAAADYFELQPVSGRLDQLRSLLQHAVYPPSAEVPGTAGLLYTLNQLLERVQASRTEVLTALREMGAVEVEGCVQVVSREAVRSAVQALLQAAVAQGWDLEAVEEERCLTALKESGAVSADIVVLRAALRGLAKEGTEQADRGQQQQWRPPSASQPAVVWRLDAGKMQAAAAQVLLRERARSAGSVEVRVPVDEFLQEWSLVAPGLLAATSDDLVRLRGVAVLTPAKGQGEGEGEEVVVYCPAGELVPLQPKARCEALFRIKSAYSAEELGPYFPDLAGPGLRDLLLTQAGCSEAPASDGSGGKLFTKQV